MPHIDPERLRRLVNEIYLSMAVPTDMAAHLADTLVKADLWGHSSHGVMRTFWYGARIASGATRLDTEPQIITDTGPLVALDGGDGIGQWVTQQAVDLAVERARRFGIAAISIRNSGHFGTAMYFTRQLAMRNMIGFLATNASPAMPPAGGREKLIGNNPQSWAAPTGLAVPYLLDFAHSAVARGKIYLAREKGEAIPVGWALDSNGQPTTDPSEAIAGTLLPMAGHKGAGLSAMMDVLSGLLSGGETGDGVTGPYVADRRSGAGHFLIAIDIASLRPLDGFLADMQAMIASWKASAPQDGVAEILYPGEPEHQHETASRSAGIALPAEILDDLLTRAASLGLDVSARDLSFRTRPQTI
jgi:LDH2 family malate/lactate/ureidoglycolate dehydrogenase